MSEITPETLFSDDVLRMVEGLAVQIQRHGLGDRYDVMRAVLLPRVVEAIARLAQERDEAEAKLAAVRSELEQELVAVENLRSACVRHEEERSELLEERDSARQDVARLQRVIAQFQAWLPTRRDAPGVTTIGLIEMELDRLLAGGQ